MAKRGRQVTFHGAFTSKAKAQRKERQVGGFIQPRLIRGHRRYVVMTENPHGQRLFTRSKKRFRSARAAWADIGRATGLAPRDVVSVGHTRSEWRWATP